MQIKFKIEQEIEEVAQILNEKHLELLKLLFPMWSKTLSNVKSKIFTNNVTRVQINFKWRAFKNKSCLYEINFKVCRYCLYFSLKTDKTLDSIFKEDFDGINFASYLNSLGIDVEVVPISESCPKNGTDGKQRSVTKSSNGHGKLPRKRKKKNGKKELLTRKQKKRKNRKKK